MGPAGCREPLLAREPEPAWQPLSAREALLAQQARLSREPLSPGELLPAQGPIRPQEPPERPGLPLWRPPGTARGQQAESRILPHVTA